MSSIPTIDRADHLTNLNQLEKLRIIIARSAEPKDDLGDDRRSIPSNVRPEEVRALKHVYQELFVFQVLVLDVCLRCSNIETIVDDLTSYSP